MFRLSIWSLLGIALTAAPGPLTAAPTKTLLRPVKGAIEVVEKPSVAAGDTLAGGKPGISLTFPGPVTAALFDSSSDHVLVSFQEPGAREAFVVAWSLSDRRIAWAGKGDVRLLWARDGRFVVSGRKGLAVGDVMSGAHVMDHDEDVQVVGGSDGAAVVISRTKWTGIDPYDGRIIWTRDARPHKGYLEATREGESLFMVADGLDMIDLQTGKGWSAPASTTREEIRKPTISEVSRAFDLGGRLGGGPWAGVMGGSAMAGKRVLVGDLAAMPIVDEDRVYFAARKTAMCLDRASGTTIWETWLPEEPGRMRLFDRDSLLVVVGLGWERVQGKFSPNGLLALYLLSKATGDVIAHFKPATDEAAIQTLVGSDGYLILTPSRLYWAAFDLGAVDSLETSKRLGYFRSMAMRSDSVRVTCERGLLAARASGLGGSGRWSEQAQVWTEPGGSRAPGTASQGPGETKRLSLPGAVAYIEDVTVTFYLTSARQSPAPRLDE